MPWSKFLKAHWEAIAAADFFTVEVWTRVGLIRYLVFFVIDLSTRRVEIAGIVLVPNGLWMRQVARHLIDDFSGFLRGKRFLIHDRDPLYTRDFRELLGYAGVTSGAITCEESESERLRGALRPLDQVGVPRPDNHARGAALAADGRQLRGALSRGAVPPRHRQPADLGGFQNSPQGRSLR